ncbi:MAG: 50S ribosomal protein L20 [Acidobacteria bacterium]|nr:50S ribosomal protein L20 [Acidobacteriota bacterium]
MPRVKRGTKRHNRRKKLLTLAKGYYLNKSKLYKFAKESVEKALGYAYRDRKARKRDFRRLWIIRIGAAARQNGLNYNQFISGLKQAGVTLDRKVLADLAIQDPAAFTRLAETAKGAARQ